MHSVVGMPNDSAKDIRDRAFAFGCKVARLALSLTPRPGVRALVDQLLRAGTSVGANLEEAKAASTRREFLRDIEISLREARESWYWLRIYNELELGDPRTVRELVSEADSLVRILTSIVLNTKRRMVTIPVVTAFCILNSALLLSS
jgi:four helix bundle protein